MNKTTKQITSMISKYWLLLLVIVLSLLIGAVRPNFFKLDNILNVFSNACLAGIAGIGLTCIRSAGEMDFSTGSLCTIGAVLVIWLMHFCGVQSYILAVILSLCGCVLCGLLNAFLHVKVGIPAFIATLSTSYLIKGVAKFLVNGTDVYKGRWNSEVFTFLGQGYLFGIIPMPAVVLLIVAVIMLYYTELTKSGKYLYAVGSSPKTCDYLGINGNVQKTKGFVICAVLCGISGIVTVSMTNGGGPYVGDPMQMQSMIVLMLGATFIKKGIFNVPGTIVGAVLIAVINNGLSLLGAVTWVKNATLGFFLLLGVSVVTYSQKRAHKGS